MNIDTVIGEDTAPTLDQFLSLDTQCSKIIIFVCLYDNSSLADMFELVEHQNEFDKMFHHYNEGRRQTDNIEDDYLCILPPNLQAYQIPNIPNRRPRASIDLSNSPHPTNRVQGADEGNIINITFVKQLTLATSSRSQATT